MPATKTRTRIIAQNFIASSGLYRDIVIPWNQVQAAASAVIGAASLASATPSASGPMYLWFNSTSTACAITLQVPIPQDIAITAPAAGSGLIIFDWMNASGNGKVAKISASLGYVPSGSEWTNATCQLMSNACVSLTGACVNAINSSSVAQFNAPTTRNGMFVLRFANRQIDDSNTSGSDFHLSSIRLRYLADRIGS